MQLFIVRRQQCKIIQNVPVGALSKDITKHGGHSAHKRNQIGQIQ